jgi:colanic acid/amylovoran biosynthesis glycosyltransferase
MALGTPVISTDCGGMEELITHDEEGWIVAIRDAEAIAQTIQKFIALEESTIKNFKFAARQKVEEQHNEDKMIKDMIDLYKRL